MPVVQALRPGLLASWRKFLLLGPPGAGKSTYGKGISELLGIPHVSMGDLLRAEVASETSIGREIKDRLAKGRVVDSDVALVVLSRFFHETLPQRMGRNVGWILDGFPRDAAQVALLPAVNVIPAGALELRIPLWVVLEKIRGRIVCSKCGGSFNTKDCVGEGINIPALRSRREGLCDRCDGALIARTDDSEAVAARRYHDYDQSIHDIMTELQTRLTSSASPLEESYPPDQLSFPPSSHASSPTQHRESPCPNNVFPIVSLSITCGYSETMERFAAAFSPASVCSRAYCEPVR